MILVTGSTGLLGTHLLYYLVKSGTKVRALKRKNSDLTTFQKVFKFLHQSQNGHPDNSLTKLYDQIEWVDGDVLDYSSLEDAFKGITKVYHCAAVISLNPSDKRNMMNINITGTANVVNLSLDKNIEKLCHVSSIAALGRANDGKLIDEKTMWTESAFNTSYAISKYLAELEVWRGIAEGLNAVIVNPSVILGAGNWKTGSTIIFPRSFKGLKYYTTGINGFVDARDVAKMMIALMENNESGKRFIISAENVSYQYLFKEMANHFEKKPPFIKVNRFMCEIAWRVIYLKSLFNGSKPIITKETVKSLFYDSAYSSENVKKATGINFMPVNTSIKELCEAYLQDIGAKKTK